MKYQWTFSIVHPSRGRPVEAMKCFKLWRERFSGQNRLEYILSLDSDDEHKYQDVIQEISKTDGSRLVVSDNDCVVKALNAGAEKATGHVLIYVSDDFSCPSDWDIEIQKAVQYREDEWVLFVFDGIQRGTQTISILSKAYYDKCGYIYYPEYKSMYADNDFMERAKALRQAIDGTHLIFKHNHFSVGGMPFDKTYERQNSREFWNAGYSLFLKRGASNWGIQEEVKPVEVHANQDGEYVVMSVCGTTMVVRYIGGPKAGKQAVLQVSKQENASA